MYDREQKLAYSNGDLKRLDALRCLMLLTRLAKGLECSFELWGELLITAETYLHHVVGSEGIKAAVRKVVDGDGSEHLRVIVSLDSAVDGDCLDEFAERRFIVEMAEDCQL